MGQTSHGIPRQAKPGSLEINKDKTEKSFLRLFCFFICHINFGANIISIRGKLLWQVYYEKYIWMQKPKNYHKEL